MTEESKPNKSFDKEIRGRMVSGNSSEISKTKTPHTNEHIRRRHHSVWMADEANENLVSDSEFFGYKTCSWVESLIQLGHEWRKKIEATHGNLEDLKKEPMFQLNVFQVMGDINITSKYETRGPKPIPRRDFDRKEAIKWAHDLVLNGIQQPLVLDCVAINAKSYLECDPSLREEPYYDLLIALLQKKGLEV